MKSKRNFIPGITKVCWLKCSDLAPHLTQKSVAGFPIAVYGEMTHMPLCGEATMENVEMTENNGRIQRDRKSVV